jgi:hypothetical protein
MGSSSPLKNRIKWERKREIHFKRLKWIQAKIGCYSNFESVKNNNIYKHIDDSEGVKIIEALIIERWAKKIRIKKKVDF